MNTLKTELRELAWLASIVTGLSLLGVWFACFPPEEPSRAYLFRNGGLMGSEVGYDARTGTIHAPIALGHACEHFATSFTAAFQCANREG